jgi:hypothetical protein
MNVQSLEDVDRVLDLYVEGIESTHGEEAAAEAVGVAEIVRRFAAWAYELRQRQWVDLLAYLNGQVPQTV